MSKGQDDDIKKLPLKERLKYQKIQAEIYALKKSFFSKPPFIMAIIILPTTGYFSGWFDVRQKRLENERILIKAENVKLENEKLLLKFNTAKLKEEYNKKNIELVKKFDDNTAKLEREFDDKKAKLDEEYEEKYLALKKELSNKENTQNQYTKLRLYLKDRFVDIKVPVTKETKKILEQYKEKLAQVKTKNEYSFDDWYYKGASEFDTKKYDNAINSFTNAIKKNPENPYAYNYRGAAYGRVGNNTEALKDFDKSSKLEPNNPLPYTNKAKIFIKQGKTVEAKEEFNKANNLIEDGKVNEGEIAFAKKEIKAVQKLLEQAK